MHPLKPTPLEIAAGIAVGWVQPPTLPASAGRDPVAAMEDALRPAVASRPCVVTFSGGRDSSAVLGVATALARREGLPPPVPATVRFESAPGTGEREWQERVLDHLRLDDWIVVQADDELDLVGPVARRHLKRHGVLLPANTSLFALLAEHARGGTLVTGIGGDQILGTGWLPHAAGALAGKVRPVGADVTAFVYRGLPRRARERIRARHVPDRPWLRPAAQAELRRLLAQSAADEPLTYGAHRVWYLGRRSLAAFCFAVDTVTADAGAVASHPLVDPGFVAALAALGGRSGLGDRTSTMRTLFRDVLPDEVLARESKALFPYAYIRDPSRAFARRWRGEGVDPDLVEPEALREAWLRLVPSGWGALALQSAWLASEGAREPEEQVADCRQALDRPRTA